MSRWDDLLEFAPDDYQEEAGWFDRLLRYGEQVDSSNDEKREAARNEVEIASMVARGAITPQDAHRAMEARALADRDPVQAVNRVRIDAATPDHPGLPSRRRASFADRRLAEIDRDLVSEDGRRREGPLQRVRPGDLVPGDVPEQVHPAHPRHREITEERAALGESAQGEGLNIRERSRAIPRREREENFAIARQAEAGLAQVEENIQAVIMGAQEMMTNLAEARDNNYMDPVEAEKRIGQVREDAIAKVRELGNLGANISDAQAMLSWSPKSVDAKRSQEAVDAALMMIPGGGVPQWATRGMVAAPHLFGDEAESMPSRVPMALELPHGMLNTVLRTTPEKRRALSILGLDGNLGQVEDRQDILANARKEVSKDAEREAEGYWTKTARRTLRAVGEVADLYMLAASSPTRLIQSSKTFQQVTARSRQYDIFRRRASETRNLAREAAAAGDATKAQKLAAKADVQDVEALALVRDEELWKTMLYRMGPALEDMTVSELATGTPWEESVLGAFFLTAATGGSAVAAARGGYGPLRAVGLTMAATFSQEFARLSFDAQKNGMDLPEVFSHALASSVGMTVGSSFADAVMDESARSEAVSDVRQGPH